MEDFTNWDECWDERSVSNTLVVWIIAYVSRYCYYYHKFINYDYYAVCKAAPFCQLIVLLSHEKSFVSDPLFIYLKDYNLIICYDRQDPWKRQSWSTKYFEEIENR